MQERFNTTKTRTRCSSCPAASKAVDDTRLSQSRSNLCAELSRQGKSSYLDSLDCVRSDRPCTLSVRRARRSSGLRRWYAFTWLSMRSRCFSAPPAGAAPLLGAAAADAFFTLLRPCTAPHPQ